jgi:hypothetical protein
MTDGWADVDNFDVDLLAEYLLDDGNASGAVTWDFSVEHHEGDSTLVSPENSEDGVLPPIGEIPTLQQQGTLLAPQTFVPAVAPGSVPPLPTTFSVLPTQVPSVGANQLMQPQAKRQRVEPPPVMATIAGSVYAPMISGQQLAQAAQVLQQQGQGRGRKKSQVQIDRRRERNRVLARRTRLRKKFFFESLQKEVMDLQRENMRLKDLVKTNVDGEESKKILDECDAMEKLPPSVLEALGEAETDMESQDFNLVSSIQKSQHAFIITDPSLQDNPIVFASDDFFEHHGLHSRTSPWTQLSVLTRFGHEQGKGGHDPQGSCRRRRRQCHSSQLHG